MAAVARPAGLSNREFGIVVTTTVVVLCAGMLAPFAGVEGRKSCNDTGETPSGWSGLPFLLPLLGIVAVVVSGIALKALAKVWVSCVAALVVAWFGVATIAYVIAVHCPT
jgi:hypothetical protein